MASAKRIYDGDQWHFGQNKHRIDTVYSYDEQSFKLLLQGRVRYEKYGEMGPDDTFEKSELANYQCEYASNNGHCYVPKNFLYTHKNFSIITLGGYVDYAADPNGNPTEETGKFYCMGYLWKTPDGSWEKYDDNGRVIAIGYKKTTIYRYEYNDGGQIQKITDANGRDAILYEYTNNFITAITDREGNRVSYEYTSGHLTKVTDVLGNQ